MPFYRSRLLHALLMVATWVAAAAETPKELGDVRWGRDYNVAAERSAETGKPILILFQEVPGCHGCIQFGQETLSHPLIVDAIESEFVPLAIRNNAPSGHDLEILRRFQEPAWNYQVMRFVDAEGKDIIPRRDRVWDSRSDSRANERGATGVRAPGASVSHIRRMVQARRAIKIQKCRLQYALLLGW